MTLWLVLGGMAICVVCILAGPSFLRRTVEPTHGREFDIAVYKDQLAEVDRDVDRGHVSADEAGTVRLEIQRRLLAAADAQDNFEASSGGAAERRTILIALVLLIPLASFGAYIQIGSPGTPDYPYAARTDISDVVQSAQGMGDMLKGLETRVASNPDDVEGWAMLARTYQVLERHADSAAAFLRLYNLTGDGRARSEYAEASILANDTVVDLAMIELLAQILRADPLDPKARFYFGVGVAQQGDLVGAIQVWTDLVHLSPADAPWLPTVQAQIADAASSAGIDLATVSPSSEVQQLAIATGIGGGTPNTMPGPTQDDIENAATMSAEDQLDMIRSMVQRLADRLQENPEDPEGWARLIQAYEVLGESEKAEQVREAAEPYLP